MFVLTWYDLKSTGLDFELAFSDFPTQVEGRVVWYSYEGLNHDLGVGSVWVSEVMVWWKCCWSLHRLSLVNPCQFLVRCPTLWKLPHVVKVLAWCRGFVHRVQHPGRKNDKTVTQWLIVFSKDFSYYEICSSITFAYLFNLSFIRLRAVLMKYNGNLLQDCQVWHDCAKWAFSRSGWHSQNLFMPNFIWHCFWHIRGWFWWCIK